MFDINSSSLLTNPLFRVESSMINKNGDANNDYLFNYYGLMNVQFIHNTIADNQVAESIFRTDYNSNITSPITLEIHSSIIDNPFSFVYSFNELGFTTGGGEMHITVSACLLTEMAFLTSNILINDANDYPEGALNSLINRVAAQYFVDRDNENYHLSENSPAIDHINTSNRITINHPDIDYENRGFDDPNTSGTVLFYDDIGADERIELPDLMFVDGFE